MNCVHFLSIFESLWPFWAGIIRNMRYGGWRSLFSFLLIRLTAESPFDLLNYAKNVSIPVWNGLFIVTQNVCMKFAKETCRIYIPMSLSNKPLSLLCSHQDTFIRKLSIRRTLNESVSSKQKDRPHRMAWGRYWNMAQTKIVDKTFHFDFQL